MGIPHARDTRVGRVWGEDMCVCVCVRVFLEVSCIATLPLEVAERRPVTVAVLAHVLPHHLARVHNAHQTTQLFPPSLFAVFRAELADQHIRAAPRPVVQPQKGGPVVLLPTHRARRRLDLRRLRRVEGTVLVLHEPRVVDHPPVVRLREQRRVGLNLLPVDVRRVVHVHARVAEGVRAEGRPRRLRPREWLVHLVRTRSTRDNVHGSLGVDVRLVRLVLVRRPHPLVVVLVPIDEEVHTVLEEDGLKVLANLHGRSVAVPVTRAVDGPVAVHHNPRHCIAVRVRLLEVVLEPGDEGVLRGLPVSYPEPQLR
eukprot:Sspe_Gene.31211::Locus_15406_Transcript_1_3_Confidence_0.250_Length_1816::g.31211::m.31211